MRILSERFIAVFLVSVFSILVLAACSSSDEPEAASAGQATAVPASTQAPVLAAQPKVNRLIMAVVPLSGIETNELRHTSSPTVWPFRSVYEYPIALDIETGQLKPGLAFLSMGAGASSQRKTWLLCGKTLAWRIAGTDRVAGGPAQWKMSRLSTITK